ncbi:MAG: hypothetical protein STHCBS139747_005789 [Sporothrix thermara]
MAEKQPLLASYQGGEVQPHMLGDDASHDVYLAGYAVGARRRRRQAVRRAHFLGFVLLLAVGYYTHGFGLPKLASTVTQWRSGSLGSPSDSDSPVNMGSTPIDGPLVLPDIPQCMLHDGSSEPHVYPLVRHSLTFGHDRNVTILQNTTRHHHPLYDDEPLCGGDDDDNDNDDNDDEVGCRWRNVHVTGEVVVRQMTDNGGKKPSVEVEAVSNDERIRTSVVFDKDTQHLAVVVDDRIWADRDEHWHDGQGACLVVRITVWVPPTAHLDTLRVGAVHVGVQLLEDLHLVVDGSARLASVIGSIVGARSLETEAVRHTHQVREPEFPSGYSFEAAQLDLATTASPIQGPWSLLDRLHIHSVSGAVDVSVRAEGKEEEEEEEEEEADTIVDLADLRIETLSGDIGFHEVKSDKPRRPHRLSLFTRSGTLHGSGSFAQVGRVGSTSGNIAVALTPHKLKQDKEKEKETSETATLDSSTVSGTTIVYLLDEAHGQPITFLESKHHAVSGAITLHYPTSWIGNIHLETLAGGKPAVEGKGVHVVPDDSPRWPPRLGHKVDAIKESPDGAADSEGKSSVKVDTVSGRVQLFFPE